MSSEPSSDSGERVPPKRVQSAFDALEQADAMLVVGSSLMVYSGYRFAEAAARAGKPIAAVNLGRTGKIGQAAAKLFSDPSKRLEEDLRNFKNYIESGLYQGV